MKKFLNIIEKSNLLKMIDKGEGEIDDRFKSLYEEAAKGDLDIFASKLIQSKDADIKKSQAYAFVSHRFPGHRERILEMLGDNIAKLSSDRGGVKVGNENFSVLIPNGYGDGATYFAVRNRDDFNESMMTYFTMIEGTFNVYSYDCGKEVYTELSGKYLAYYYEKIVVLLKA